MHERIDPGGGHIWILVEVVYDIEIRVGAQENVCAAAAIAFSVNKPSPRIIPCYIAQGKDAAVQGCSTLSSWTG
jgi:hypothetical protein